jgi:hypothetical protein
MRDGSTDDGTEITAQQRFRMEEILNKKKNLKSDSQQRRRHINYINSPNLSIETSNPIVESMSKDSTGTINSSRFNRLMHRIHDYDKAAAATAIGTTN